MAGSLRVNYGALVSPHALSDHQRPAGRLTVAANARHLLAHK